MVLLNLLIAIMGDTWQSVKESADEKWKFLLVLDMEEFFDLYPVPPPVNALILLRRIHEHLASSGDEGPKAAQPRGPLLTSSDIKKKSKVAQHDLLQKQAALEARTMEAQLERLSSGQLTSHETLERLATAAGVTQRAVAQLAQAQQQQQYMLEQQQLLLHEQTLSPSRMASGAARIERELSGASPAGANRHKRHSLRAPSHARGLGLPSISRAPSGLR